MHNIHNIILRNNKNIENIGKFFSAQYFNVSNKYGVYQIQAIIYNFANSFNRFILYTYG